MVAMYHHRVVENCGEAMLVSQNFFPTEPEPVVVSATPEGARRP